MNHGNSSISSAGSISRPENGAAEGSDKSRLAAQAARTGSLLFDKDRTLHWFNASASRWARRFFAIELREGLPFSTIFSPQDSAAFGESFTLALEGQHCQFNCCFLYQDDEERRYELRFNPVTAPAGAVEEVLVEITDVELRRLSARSLLQDDELFRRLVQNSSDVLTVLGEDGMIRYMSPAVEQILGFPAESLVGLRGEDLLHPDDLDKLRSQLAPRSFEPGTRISHMHRVQHADGTWLTMESVASNLLEVPDIRGFVINSRDITERQRLAQEVSRAARLESLGVLAGGIAHDFNNILLAIVGNLSLAKIAAPDIKPLQDRLNDAERASLRAKDLTQQLLTFAKGGAPVRNPHHLAEIIRDSVEFVLHGQQIQVIFQLANDLWPVEADAGQISQVLNNLAINALQALPGGGQLTIRAGNEIIRDGATVPLRPGRYVRIQVADNGSGIPEEVLAHLFEPFITTKTGGSGLGLATSYSIIRKHDGLIEADSDPARGTTFTIYLPASDKQPEPEPEDDVEDLSGSGRVLLMDDDPDIRNTIGELLGTFGYEVLAVPDGETLLAKYEEALRDNNPFRVVITDLTIPGGMGGQEALERLRKIDPKARAIVSSGYSNDALLADYRENGFHGMVAKPYKAQTLARVIRQVLNEPAVKPTSPPQTLIRIPSP